MPTLDAFDLPQLLQQRECWNDLWTRSPSRLPSQRAEGIDLWCRTFAPESQLVALVARQDDRLLAALPLIKERRGPLLTIHRLPSNATVRSGDLLLDPACNADALRLIADGVCSLPGNLVSFDQIDVHAPKWVMLMERLRRGRREMHLSPGHQVGVIDILHDWDAYTRSWSRNHRSALKRTRKKFEAEGEVEVCRLREPSDELLYQTLDACFEIEDQSWKGDTGTSILKTPGLRDYYQREASLLRDAGMLDLWLLKLDGQIVAFEYCHLAKSICFSHKISFDPKWERFSPGRLLRYYQLQTFHADRSIREFDTLGVLCQAKAKWTTRSYTCGRVLVATGGSGSNWLLKLAKAYRRGVQTMPGRPSLPAPIVPGAARYLELARPQPDPTAESALRVGGLPGGPLAADVGQIWTVS